MWTRFKDIRSGGGTKEDFEYLYIEAPYDEAIGVFYSRFGHSPTRVSCTCCGEDYGIYEDDTLEEITEYERGNKTLEEHLKMPDVRVIRADDINDKERIRTAEIPQEGYV